jgi:hypothetical protein
LHRETVEGLARRFKLRIRSYRGVDGPLFLEIKRREVGAISKARAAVDTRHLEAVLRGSTAGSSVGVTGVIAEEFIGLMRHLDAIPVVMVRYEREAYLAAVDPGARVTFDRQLSSAVTEEFTPRHSGPDWHAVAPRQVILELKFRGRCPAWMAACVQRLELTRVSFSKYSHAVGTEARHGRLVALS